MCFNGQKYIFATGSVKYPLETAKIIHREKHLKSTLYNILGYHYQDILYYSVYSGYNGKVI